MNKTQTINQLISFIKAAVTPYHAVRQMVTELEASGFTGLDEKHSWKLVAGGKYYTTRNGSSIVAWQMPSQRDVVDSGMRMLGAHTDSPCLKVEPNPEIEKDGYLQLGVQIYGGVLLNPWFDRDLSLAGRVTFSDLHGQVASSLINFEKALAIVPSLAIHLNREANNGFKINPQTMVTPILGQKQAGDKQEKFDFRALLKQHLLEQGVEVERVLDFDLSFYDVQGAATVGLNDEFFASARLDNLLSCFMGLQALLTAGSTEGMLLVCNDHEEVGSMSAVGAQGPMLEQVLSRMTGSAEQKNRMIANSMLISADNAHGVHPNFSDKHDAKHGPILNAGPVIKVNANQRYATNDITSAMFRQFAAAVETPVQAFVIRADMGCGSTIGPITAAELGVKTLDIGVPQFAMHSIRELAGCADVLNTIEIFKCFLQQPQV
ncbi:MAG: M18 family aminopeptidase [Pseudomonadales bacterium]|nr:M18 family aminopeptidase [Pseudomonadales bacterium]